MERFDARENPSEMARDDYNEEEHAAAKRAGAVLGGDAEYRARMHSALDDLLSRIEARSHCVGDRQRGRRR